MTDFVKDFVAMLCLIGIGYGVMLIGYGLGG
jgi:hypothetical protein